MQQYMYIALRWSNVQQHAKRYPTCSTATAVQYTALDICEAYACAYMWQALQAGTEDAPPPSARTTRTRTRTVLVVVLYLHHCQKGHVALSGVGEEEPGEQRRRKSDSMPSPPMSINPWILVR